MTDPAPLLTPTAVAALLLDTEPYLSCDDCFDRLDTWAERQLADPADQQGADLAMDAHLAGCGACADEAGALLDLLAGGAPRDGR